MNVVRKILKYILYFLLPAISYFVLSLILGSITINGTESHEDSNKSIFLASNGVHLDIVIPKGNINSTLLSDLNHYSNENYLAIWMGR